MKKYSIILHHSALELIKDLPWKEVPRHPSVVNEARRRRKSPGNIMFDLSGHHSAVKRRSIDDRGRPDLVHLAIMSVIYTPVFLQNNCELWIHTRNDKYFQVILGWRVPVNYNRFKGLMENLFTSDRLQIVIDEQKFDITLQEGSLTAIIDKISPEIVVEWTTTGTPVSLKEKELIEKHRTTFLIGGYQRGTVPLSLSGNYQFLPLSMFEEQVPAWSVSAYTCYSLPLCTLK